jgi:hypothetical protein
MAFAEESFIRKEGRVYHFSSDNKDFEFAMDFKDIPSNSLDELYIRLRIFADYQIYNLIKSHVYVRLKETLDKNSVRLNSITEYIYNDIIPHVNNDINNERSDMTRFDVKVARIEEIEALPDPPTEPQVSEVIEYQTHHGAIGF